MVFIYNTLGPNLLDVNKLAANFQSHISSAPFDSLETRLDPDSTHIALLSWEDYLARGERFCGFDLRYWVFYNSKTISASDHEKLLDLVQSEDTIWATSDLALDTRLLLPPLRVVSHLASAFDQSDYKKIEGILDEMVSSGLNELLKIKSLHKKIVPIKKERFRGGIVYSKYAAGETSGGDFFDLKRIDGRLMFFLYSSRSYLNTLEVINRYQDLSTVSEIDLEKLSSCLWEIKFPNADENQALTAGVFDWTDLCLKGHMFGGMAIFSSVKNFVFGKDVPIEKSFSDQSLVSLKLERGEVLLVLSAGAKKLIDELFNDVSFRQFFKDNYAKGAREFLDELFIKFKGLSSGEFLKYDSTVFLIEVNENAIVQI